MRCRRFPLCKSVLLLSGVVATLAIAQVPTNATSSTREWSQVAADVAIARWPHGVSIADGTPQQGQGLLLQGMDAVWFASASPAYFRYTKQAIDRILSGDGAGTVSTMWNERPDSALLGTQLLLLNGVTGEAKYYKAAQLLRQQLSRPTGRARNGTQNGPSRPSQISIMAQPFLAEYAKTFQESSAFDAIAKRLLGVDAQARYTAPYALALVDTLSSFPEDHPRREELMGALSRLAEGLVQHQDGKTGLWRGGTVQGQQRLKLVNVCEASMYVYALEKGVRLGYLPPKYQPVAIHGYDAILKQLVETRSARASHEESKTKAIDGSISMAAIGPRTMGAFLLASAENEMAATARVGRGYTVLIDAWFNSQKKQNAAGQTVLYHYKWDDLADSGYSFFGYAFRSHGVKTDTLYVAPTLANLSKAQIYIIASPDIPSKNPKPHYLSTQDADEIAKWVEQGGVLVLMENDGKNAEFEHFNELSDRFGIHFNAVVNNHGEEFEKGKVLVPADGAIFLHVHKTYMKDICSITASLPAWATLPWEGNTVMSVAKYGRGTVYAVADPWLYNEYTDGRKLPADFDNFEAAKEMVRWLVHQVPATASIHE